MVKLIGVLLIASSLLSLIAAAYIDVHYSSANQISGNIIFNMLSQPQVNTGFFDYVEATAFSYSIVSFIIGFVFLFRV